MATANQIVDKSTGAVLNALDRKEQRLKEVLASATKAGKEEAKAEYEAYKERCFMYLQDLAEIQKAAAEAEHLKQVSKTTFRRILDKGDFAEIIVDEKFCKMAKITRIDDVLWFVYLAPVKLL